MERKPYEVEYAICPKSGIEANSYDEVERIFGYRNKGKGKKIVQSYCKKERSKYRKKRRKK
jgi:hypothetical protein